VTYSGNDSSRIADGDEVWCQGFSEPGAGSDLGGLRTRAARHAMNSFHRQKVWTSYATARTGVFCSVDRCGTREAQGISLTARRHATPASRRPLQQINRNAEFCEVFFDGARLCRNLLGKPGTGWQIRWASSRTSAGRSGVRLSADDSRSLPKESSMWLVPLHRNARERSSARPASSIDIRQRLAQAYIESRCRSPVGLSQTARKSCGSGKPGSKLDGEVLGSETDQRLQELRLEIAGPYAALWARSTAVAGGVFTDGALYSRSETHHGRNVGDPRNIIAQRILGLPRSEGATMDYEQISIRSTRRRDDHAQSSER